jgi:hypothetical protein
MLIQRNNFVFKTHGQLLNHNQLLWKILNQDKIAVILMRQLQHQQLLQLQRLLLLMHHQLIQNQKNLKAKLLQIQLPLKLIHKMLEKHKVVIVLNNQMLLQLHKQVQKLLDNQVLQIKHKVHHHHLHLMLLIQMLNHRKLLNKQLQLKLLIQVQVPISTDI